MLSSEQNPEWSVARDDDSSTIAGYIIFFLPRRVFVQIS
jgi:hypothetical protein